MMQCILILLCLLGLELSASTSITGTDCLVTPSGWPTKCYDRLQVTLNVISEDLDARGVYCDLCLPSGTTIGTYSTDVNEAGIGIFAFPTTTLNHYGEGGVFTLNNLRILTPEGFAAISDTYTTNEYSLENFRPLCQSTLLSCDNGVEVSLGETSLVLDFECPEQSDVLPEFFFQEETVYDGYAVAIDSLLEDISFNSSWEDIFETLTYTGCDVSAQAFANLASQGDQDNNVDAGEALHLQVPIQWNGNEFGAENPEEFVYLLLFYHLTEQEFVDYDAVKVHPFDANRNLQISKSELDEGHRLWVEGSVSPQFLLEAVNLCDATTYEYDYFNDRYTPYWP